MSFQRSVSFICFLILGILVSCLDPYQPEISKLETDFLIIHGHINSSNNTATINLTRTVDLSDTSRFSPESGASVLIEDLNSQKIALSEVATGIYSGAATFDYDKRYRLLVTSKEGKKYYSDFIQLEHSQITESLIWEADDESLEIFLNAQDFISGPKYYRFTFEETFEYRSYYSSHYLFVNGVVEPRPLEESIFQCWQTLSSGSIILESTENLSENIISDLPLLEIKKGDKRLNFNYSFLVKQITLNETAYNYWLQLRKTTESLGGLFDPIPSSIKGNIESETGDNVLGFFSGGDVTEKRILIHSQMLPNGYSDLPEENCDEYQKPIADINELNGTSALLTTEYGGFSLEGYYYTTPECGDCRLKGGINKEPEFMK